MSFKPTPYRLMNVATGRVFDDAGWTMGDPEGGRPSPPWGVVGDKP